ncbi:MAG: RHS repeat-associated core domain-containing protein, partial [Candidatus Staskawiczbacteria bacterium]|nr:RHS repeat-associated core domain-containing protein [Candidatus Staskawiczbacteria bacterium]
EYDAETGLNYLNARYYNSNIGRFISQDPMFWDFSEDYLSDPQQWNSYSYARNNPIVYSDPTGEEAMLGMRDVAGLGAHGDIIIIPERGQNYSQYGDGPNYIIAGGPDYSYKPFGNLKTHIEGNTFDQSNYLSVFSLAVPEGMTPAQYDRALLDSGSNLSKQDLGPYFPTGRPISPWANSGNVWTQVIEDAGGKVPEVQNNYAGPGIFGKNTSHYPLGSGNSINTNWYPVGVAKATYNTTKAAVTTTVSIIKNTATEISSAISSTARSIGASTSSFMSSLRLRY